MPTKPEVAAVPAEKPKRTREPIDPEIDLIGKTLRGLGALDNRARRRVADYIESWVSSQERREVPGPDGG